MVVNGRVKPREDTDLIDVAVGPTAYPLDEFILVLRIPTAYVTGQSVCVHRSHRERLGGRNEKEKERKGRGREEERQGHPGYVPWIRPQRSRTDTRVRGTASAQRSGNI